MVAYTSAFLAAANLLALVHAAPAQPVCQAVIKVVTGSPIWVPRADPTTSAGWGAWPPKGTTSSPAVTTKSTRPPVWSVSTGPSTWTTSTPVTYTTPSWTTSTPSPTTITVSTPSPTIPSTSTIVYTPTTSSTPAPAAPTCDTVTHNVFSAGTTSGSCGCDFTVNCNRHAPYTSDTKFWERTSGEIIESLQECLNICNDNSECQAVVWSNQDGESASDYKRCWQTSGLPQPDSDGYGQLSYKGSCSSSCSQSYTG